MIRSHRRCALGTLGLLFVAGLLGNNASGQTLSSTSIVGVTNSSVSFFIGSLDSADSSTGAEVIASANHSFTGADDSGNTRTMNFIGQARTSAQYGRLRSYATGAVSNTYYKSTNPVYYNSSTNTTDPNGSPDGLVSLGIAAFEDTLQFGGSLQAGYKARYIFHIDGTNTGYGALADLSVSIAGHSAENFFITSDGFSSNNFSTGSYDINGITAQTIRTQFSSQFVLNTYDVDDGSNISGTSDFSATATLVQVQVVDADGDPVSGVTVSSASGTQYSTVPEPGPLAVIASFGLVFARRRAR